MHIFYDPYKLRYMILQTEHKGFSIYWSETEDGWRCADLSLSDQSLAAIKRAIDARSAAERRANIRALWLRRIYRNNMLTVEDVTITIVCDPPGSPNRSQYVWLDGASDGRAKVGIDSLYPLGARPELEAICRRDAEHQAAGRQLEKDRRAISCLTLDDIGREKAEQKAKPRK